jgi:3-oxoacyl-[acyl-carrier-protein] synthase-3
VQLDHVYISSIGSYLPARVQVLDALAAGWYEADRASEDRIESVGVEPDLAPPEMAIKAARRALSRSDHGAAEVSLLLHAGCYRQGPEFWSAASYIERFAICKSVPAIEIRQGCCGGFAGLSIAIGHLSVNPATAAVITTADRFAGDFDRWRSDSGMIYGDGAAAVVVSGRPGVARVRSLATRTDPRLEEMHRGTEPICQATDRRRALDVRSRKKSYLASVGIEHCLELFHTQLVAAVDEALSDARADRDDVRVVVLPHLGYDLIEEQYLRPLGVPVERTTWPWGRHVGHLGTSDQFVALEQLLAEQTVTAGDLALMIGVGIGFTWYASVVEIL